MKNTTKLLALMLSFVMLLCFLPHSVLAQIGEVFTSEENDALTDLPVADSTESQDTDTEVYVLGEMVENRTETAKTFRMSDGSYVAADYGKPIHFEDENGIWQDYDNTLAFSDAVTYDIDDFAGYIISDSDISVKLANNSNSNNLLKITKGDYKISLHLVDAQKSKALEVYPAEEEPVGNDLDSATTLHRFSSGAIYKDILPSTDLEYIIYGNSVKENIIVKEKGDSYVYTFELKLNGLVPALQSDGSIALNDEDSNETVLVIPNGYMYDANDESSNAVNYSIVHKNGKKYTLTVTADSEWINAEERAFPVTIDPTVKGFESGRDTYDTQVSQANPEENYYAASHILVGYDESDNTKQNHILIGAQNLPELPNSAVVVSATIRMYARNVVSGGATVCAYPIVDEWTSDEVTWSSRPIDIGIAVDYNVINVKPENNYVYWDVTRAAQGWYNNPATHYGIALRPVSGGNTGFIRFYSSDSVEKPVFYITYWDTKGLESIWTYSAQSAGSAGTGYVNGYNGNLVFVHNDMTTKGGILPITVSHVYNSSLANLDFTAGESINAPATAEYGDMLIGLGWKLSVQESLVVKTIDEIDYFVYNDSDGTEHYYYLDSTNNKYIDESGIGWELTVGSNGNEKYIITDELGNKKYFNTAGMVTKITDVRGNKKEYIYNSSSQLTSITSTPKNSTAETQLTFTYNTNGALSRITDGCDTNKYIVYYYSYGNASVYDANYNGYLRKIEYFNDGASLGYSTYEYNANGLLISAFDSISNYKLTYTYANYNGNPRVATAAESAGSNNGQTVGFEYGNKLFAVRTSGSDDIYGTADDLKTTHVFDNHGRTICAYSSNLSGDEIYGASYAEYTPTDVGSEQNHKIKTSAVKGITRQNYFVDGNLETASGWSQATHNGGTAAYSTDDSLFGEKSMKLTGTTDTSMAMYYRYFTIPEAGTYTVSAYVKTVNVSGTGGITVTLDNAHSETLKGTTNTAINEGWRRISVTKTFASSGSYIIGVSLENASGSAYVDCIQLEKSDAPSDFNFIDNGGLESVRKWSGSYTLATGIIGSYGAQLTGMPTAQNRISQTVNVNVPLNTTFMLSGWAKAESVGLKDESRKFGILATLTYSDNTTEEHYLSFNADNINWQYATLAIVPKTENTALAVNSITISLCYDYNANTALFDDIALTVEPAQTYAYDDEGNIKSAKDAEGNESLLDYADNGIDLESYTTPTNEKYDYTYIKDSNNNDTHLVDTVTRTSNNVTQTMDYDYNDFGQVISTALSASGIGEIITSSATYTDDGNYLISATNQLGTVTNYNYETVTKLLSYVENANSVRTAYVYDEFERVETIYLDSDEDDVPDTAEAQVSYLYASGRLSGIDTATTDYSLTYDAFGNILTIKARDNTLATYEYAANNGKLLKLTYGNGDVEEYVYDNLERLVSTKLNGVTEYTVKYDNNGRLASLTEDGATHIYEYDSLDRLIRAWQEDDNGNRVLAVENCYDELGRAKGSTYFVGEREMSYEINYKANSNLVDYVLMPVAEMLSSISYTYDEFERVTKKQISFFSALNYYEEYGYYNYTDADGAQHTTSLISSLKLGGNTPHTPTTVYTYTYDNLGNIIQIMKNGALAESYEYDSLGQLTRANNVAANYTILYRYDKSGNIVSSERFDYADAPTWHMEILAGTGAVTSYTYSNSSWGDLLTNFNGTAISYDEIGNPTNWRNINSMTWEGRELQGITLSDSDWLTYTYNADGIRTQKYFFNDIEMYGTTHDYVLDGTKIIRETVTGDGNNYTLYYLYDTSGSVQGFIYNNNYYYYQKNLQGDVIRILNSNGTVVTEYTYDAWGKVLSVSGTMANTLGQYNPFRYRSYYYDEETGWYYLQSRYYDPVVGRFLNADGIVGANGGIEGYNMFAYCNNNPVMYVDYSGYSANNEYEGALEELILWYHELFYECKDNFGFVGDIAVGFDKIGSSTITAEWFIRAMRNVGFKATPALIDRYNALVSEDKQVTYDACLFGVVSIDFAVYFGPVSIQTSYVKDKDGNLDKQRTVSLNASLAIGVEAGFSISTAQNVSDMTGFTASNTWSKGKGAYANGSVGIMPSGHTVYSGSVFFGAKTTFLIDEYPSISWTWST